MPSRLSVNEALLCYPVHLHYLSLSFEREVSVK